MTLPVQFYSFRRRTAQGLTAIVAFAVFAFGAVDVEAYALVLAAVLALLAAWTVKKVADPFPVVLTPLYIPVGLMALAAVVQVLLGRTEAPYETGGALLDWALYAAFFFLAVNTLTDASLRKSYYDWFVGIVSLAALVGMVQALTVPGSVYWFREVPGVRPFGPFASADHFIVLVELAFPVALTLGLRDRARQLYYFLACILMALSLAASGSKTGLAVLAVQFVFVVAAMTAGSYRSALRSRRRGPAFVFGLLGSVALGMTFLLAAWNMGVLRISTAELEPAQALLARNEGLLARADVLDTTWKLIRQQPWIGHGFGAFGLVFDRAAPQRDVFAWTHAQCDPLELGVETGLVGLLAQALLIGMILWRARSLRMWGLAVTPLAGAWAHSWFSTPIQTPALVLAALALLACTPGMTERVAVKRASKPKPDAPEREEKPRGYYSSRSRYDD